MLQQRAINASKDLQAIEVLVHDHQKLQNQCSVSVVTWSEAFDNMWVCCCAG